MIKNILLVGLLLLLIGGVIGYKIYNKPHQDMLQAKSEMSISAHKLYSDYQASESDANNIYLGKVITVEGEVEEINKKAENKNQIIISTGDMISRISCDLDYLSEHDGISDLKVGDQVKIKGKCAGILMDVVLDRCIILN